MAELLRAEVAHFYDTEFNSDYAELEPRLQSYRHILLHVNKAGLKLARYLSEEEGYDKQVIVGEVIPDLLLYRTMLINHLGEDFDESEFEGREAISDSATGSIMTAAGLLGRVIEPAEHAGQMHTDEEVALVAEAAFYLHDAGRELAWNACIDPDIALQARIEQLLS